MAEEFGHPQAIQILGEILRHERLPDGLFLRVMSHIGRAHDATIQGPSGWQGWYGWPECWAARALGYLGPAAEPVLLTAKHHPHWRLRRTIVRSLGWVGGPDSLDHVRESASDPDPRVRAQSLISEAKILARLSKPG